MKKISFIAGGCFTLFGLLFSTTPVFANIPGGGTGTGANVTVTDNGNGTVTMANGVVSILIYKSGASISQINYTYNNGGGTQTQNLLAGGKNGGKFYWEFGGFGGNPWVYSLVTNNGNYAEVHMSSDSPSNGVVDVHYSMLRGSPGFYATPIFSHRAQDPAQGTGEERDNIYIAPYFNWMSVNDQVQRETGINASYTGAFYSPVENSLCTSGPLQGTYDDKYKWSSDFSAEKVWGWSSVSDSAYGVTGQNVGIWHVVSSWEFYNGGPLKPDLNDAPMVNMINGGHYYFGNDSGYAPGEVWTRVSGPYFIYVNNVSNSLTDPVQTSQALWADAKAQAAAEGTAWPYSWMNNENYASAAQRGTVTGQIVINDAFNPNASASNLWVGVEQQPAYTGNNVYDFQLWSKPYEFWTKTDANGNFVISNVIAGNNYTLYAFGPGASGMLMSKNQNGGNPGIIYALPSSPFTVVVTGGATSRLGTVTWTPARVGPTVFQIGCQTRKGDKFRHGDDYWVGDVGPNPTAPSPVWTKFLDFPFDFPNGLNYVVGQNRWNTDWNFVQSVYPDLSGNNDVSSSTVTFNLASAPASGAMASVLMGIASDDNTPIYVTVNGTLLSNGNATGTPNTSLPTTGWFPNNNISDSNIREENHGGYSDERLTFAGSLLHAGNNTINFSFRQAGASNFTHHFMYDYVRLELTGYVPPAPAGVTAYAANNAVQLSWPAVAGATSYNLLRSTISGSGYVSITNGVTGPMCGSGPANAVYVDHTAANGTTYYYVVQSVNTVGASGNSAPSARAMPSSGIATTVPATPAGLVAGLGNSAVTLTWNAVSGANFYTVYRGTVVNKLGYVPFYIILSNTTTNNAYTDASGTLGCTYSYFVTATSAGGTSGNSTAVTAKPVPLAPANPPANVRITDTITSNSQTATITWSPVSGAVGYILYRANNPAGPFSFPGNYVQSMTTTNYTDSGLNTNTLYAYMVIAMNAGGVSGNSAVVGTPPAAPTGFTATTGNSQIVLSWTASTGATSYNVKRSTTSGSGYATIASLVTTSYTDTTVTTGTTYYYVVSAVYNGGESINSSQVSAIPVLASSVITWAPPVNIGAAGINDVSTNGTLKYAYTWGLNGTTVNGVPFTYSTSTTGNANVAIAISAGGTDPSGEGVGVTGTPYGNLSAAYQTLVKGTVWANTGAPGTITLQNLSVGSAYQVQIWENDSRGGNYATRVMQLGSNGGTPVNLAHYVGGTATSAAGGLGQYVVGTFTAYASSQVITLSDSCTAGSPGNQINSIQVRSLAGTPPAVPNGLAATAGNNQVGLTWSVASGATSHNVKRSTTSGSGYMTIASSAAARYTDPTATNGTTYYYVVSAVNGSGESANSSQASATPKPMAPAAPTSLAATAGNAQMSLSWTASSDATSYNVKRSINSGSGYATIGSPAATSYTDITAANGMTYYYVVSAVNAGGESANSSQVSAIPAALPSPWATADIGAVGVAGSATYGNGLFTVKGSGADIWGAADAFRYVYQPASGDCSIQARVLSVQNTAAWAKAGVMIRESTNANSVYAMAFLAPVTITSTNGVAFQQRISTGGTTSSIKSVPGLQAPYWVKLARTGNSFVGSCSADGINWTALGTNSLTMATNVYIGLPVCSVLNTLLNTATFTNVTAVP